MKWFVAECKGSHRGVIGQGKMSEPMSHGDIEDVLSSIRRLVTEDLRPATKGANGAKPASPATSGKLLLTPALRVVSNQETVPRGAASVASVAPKLNAPTDRSKTDMTGRAADLSDTAQERGAMARPTQADDNTGPSSSTDSGTGSGTISECEDWLPESDVDSGSFPGSAKSRGRAEEPAHAAEINITRVVSEIAAGVSDAEEEWEPEIGDAPLASMNWQAPEWVEEAELADEDHAAKKASVEQAEDAAVAEIMARAAQAKADASARAAKPAEPEPESDIFAEDDGYYDETVLRDLVRDLIREELSGTLGERITRNVRKLVRAEINRALTARDFD